MFKPNSTSQTVSKIRRDLRACSEETDSGLNLRSVPTLAPRAPSWDEVGGPGQVHRANTGGWAGYANAHKPTANRVEAAGERARRAVTSEAQHRSQLPIKGRKDSLVFLKHPFSTQTNTALAPDWTDRRWRSLCRFRCSWGRIPGCDWVRGWWAWPVLDHHPPFVSWPVECSWTRSLSATPPVAGQKYQLFNEQRQLFLSLWLFSFVWE